MTTLSERRSGVRTATRRRNASAYLPVVTLLVDFGLISVATSLAVVGRERLSWFESAEVTGTIDVAGPLIILGWLLAIRLLGGYRVDVFGAGTEEYMRILNAGLLTAGGVGVGCYLTQFLLSRGFFMLLFATGVPLLLLGRLTVRRIVQKARMRGALAQRVLIVGGPAHVDEIAAVLRRESWLGYHVIAALTPATHVAEGTASGIPVVGNTDDVDLMLDAGVDLIFFAGGAQTSADDMRRAVWRLEDHDVQVVVAPSVTDISSDRIRVRPVGGLPLIHLAPPTWYNASRTSKRIFDLVGATAFLVALSPVMLGSAIWVKLHDRGPVLFRQRRIGRDGREFNCLKFRSMVVDAEARLTELHATQGYENGLFKMKDDPRITAPGRPLRRYSIDELPQLFNVLRGDMSLVGPRPPLPSEVEAYEEHVLRRLHVRPGLTGLWQVSGRSDLAWDEAVRLDLYYVDNWSMLQDVNILLKTLGAVFRSRGAY